MTFLIIIKQLHQNIIKIAALCSTKCTMDKFAMKKEIPEICECCFHFHRLELNCCHAELIQVPYLKPFVAGHRFLLQFP